MSDTLAAWLQRLEHLHPVGIDLGLDRCGRVYRSMDSPRPGKQVITVAGTNGKGSMVAYLYGILNAAGYRCGTYTSPHLLRFNERVTIEGSPVTDQIMVKAFERTEARRNGVSLTYFEFTTLAAFSVLHQADLDFAILEVGLGGRLDAVNLVHPDCAVITPIGLDHQEYLGADREAIGREKAGIMRPGTPVVCGDRSPPDSVIEHARQLQAKLLILGQQFEYSIEHGRLVFQGAKPDQIGTANHVVSVPTPPLPGHHQLDNLATALGVVEALQPHCLGEPEHLAAGINSVRLAGRLSSVTRDSRVMVDVGHNPLAAQAIAQHLAEQCSQTTHCVLGMLKDKDAEGVVLALGPWVDHWYCAGLEGQRGQSGVALQARLLKTLPSASACAASTVAEALSLARDRAGKSDRILVFGSFLTASAALHALGE